MFGHCLIRRWLRLAILAAVAVSVPVVADAADPAKGLGPADPNSQTVDFFAAIHEGQISAQLIPRDAWQGRLLLTNKTDKPLNVRLPDVFGGVPVAAQLFPPGGNANQDRKQGGNKNAPQSLAVGMPFGNNLAGPMNNRNNPMMNVPNRGNNRMNQGPLFNVAPERTGQLKIASLCLEHGKPNPRPSIPYEIRPIESVAAKAEVQEIARMFAQGEVSQRAAQAAAWHLANGLTWDKLQAEKAVKLALWSEPLFSPQDLSRAKKAVDKATQQVKQRQTPSSSQSASGGSPAGSGVPQVATDGSRR